MIWIVINNTWCFHRPGMSYEGALALCHIIKQLQKKKRSNFLTFFCVFVFNLNTYEQYEIDSCIAVSWKSTEPLSNDYYSSAMQTIWKIRQKMNKKYQTAAQSKQRSPKKIIAPKAEQKQILGQQNIRCFTINSNTA